MFRINPAFQLSMPASLNDGQGSTLYRLVELSNNLPVWILQVHEAPNALNPVPRWRRMLIHDLREALTIAGLAQWSARNLYALLPEYLSPTKALSSSLCMAIWECHEPDDDELCWRIGTEHGVALESQHGTQPGKERKQRQLWFAKRLNDDGPPLSGPPQPPQGQHDEDRRH